MQQTITDISKYGATPRINQVKNHKIFDLKTLGKYIHKSFDSTKFVNHRKSNAG